MPSTSRSRGAARAPAAPDGPLAPAPVSERQQLALVMQMSTQDAPPAAPTPAEERKRTRQQRNERGETPVHVAAIRGDSEQVQKLIDQGQDLDVPDFAGWTPLHEACSYGWLPVVQVLVRGGADVNARGLDDDTPLHDAATSGNLHMVQFLVEHGAEPFVKNTKGKMPSDYAAAEILDYLESLKDNARGSHVGRARDDSHKKGGNAGCGDAGKRAAMDSLAQDHYDGKDARAQEKGGSEGRDDGHVGTGVSSTQDEAGGGGKRPHGDEGPEAEADEDCSRRKKRREHEDKEPMARPAAAARQAARLITGSKTPGPASRTGAAPLGRAASGAAKGGGKGAQGAAKGGGRGAQGSHQGKSSGGAKGSASQGGRQERRSPVASPKAGQGRDAEDDEQRSQEALKVPPLKIVIPGGAGASGGRGEREDDGGAGARGGGKGRGGAAALPLPYVIPCSGAGAGDSSDSSDGNSDDRRPIESLKAHEHEHAAAAAAGGRAEGSSELHPRKRKLKRDSHREAKGEHAAEHGAAAPGGASGGALGGASGGAHGNPYQMYIHIRKQIANRQRALFPVKPKPPKDFNKYLMNRCTYTLRGNVSAPPPAELPRGLPPQMAAEFRAHEAERTRLRVQHLVEKEKLVLAVEQEILRVHGRAERAVANQALPFSACTMLRDREVYNLVPPEQEEKRNAQRSRCNGRQINSWLQEVDDKWEKIKEGMLRRQHTEAETLHAVQRMGWEWKLKELSLCEHKSSPRIDAAHVPRVHVSNFDLPA